MKMSKKCGLLLLVLSFFYAITVWADEPSSAATDATAVTATSTPTPIAVNIRGGGKSTLATTPTPAATSDLSADPTPTPSAGPFTVPSGTNAVTMLENIANTVPALMQLVTAVAYVIGMVLVLKGVIKLRHFGEARTQMSETHNMMGPFIYFGVGGLLLALPSAVKTGLNTFWKVANPYAYVTDKAQDQWCTVIQDVFLLMQLVGTIAFIRGLLLLTQTGGHHGGQPGMTGKAFTHIIAGILCIDMYDTLNTIFTTLGIQANWCFAKT